ncbi:MAG: hypothetical protein KDI38_04340 [Calditrichaeota bacterium]|nr:hypothetical protein [Calditrichota bacterium]MCB0302987.1 hypothetical protein [Calditrichota bacterium]MCB0312203.1 hypothetical protein [Calditrichota bacterium]
MAAKIQEIRKILPEVKPELFSKPNVLATGIGYKVVQGKATEEVCFICSVGTKKAKSLLSANELLPKTVGGVAVDVVATGPIYAQQAPTGRFRPAPGGVSVGHYLITAGTLGCWVRKNGKFYMLSNNHVLANSNDASIGDAILQPGPYDGGNNPADKIATLSEFVPIEFDGGSGGGGGSNCSIANSIASVLNVMAATVGSETRMAAVLTPRTPSGQAAQNLVDCAIAEPLNQNDVRNEILNIGPVTQTAEAALGMAVKKMGRTTSFTTGTIQQIDATVTVNYGSNRNATFVDQLITSAMSEGGDSGSAVVNDSNQLVGLLYAGSTTITILNRIQNVFTALGVSL